MMRAEKTGTHLAIPILPELQAILEATPSAGLALIARNDGQNLTKESFGNWFREACKAAGVPGSAHGLRKAGATVPQLNAIFGRQGDKMASHYTRTADGARLARQAIGKLGKNET
jgi:hypothetical protein